MDEPLKIAKLFVGEIQKAGYLVHSAYLFGSYAKGHARKDSDIDICIVSTKFGKNYMRELVDLQMIAHKIDSRIEAHPFTPKDLANPYDALSFEIRNTGVAIMPN